jgi:CheY-like chemotaxis protein
MDKKILFIEDDFLIADLYKRQLLLAGYIVTLVASGEEGVKAAQQDSFDLILSDMSLPGITGIEVLTQMKQQEKIKNIPFILFSNMAQESYIQDAKKLGASDYWIKDQLLPAQLVQKITTVLSTQPDITTASNG